MITENKVIEIFCIMDEFAGILHPSVRKTFGGTKSTVTATARGKLSIVR